MKFYDYADITEFEANVLLTVEEKGAFWTLLDQTAFYLEAGGMAEDEGKLNGYPVMALKQTNQGIFHLLP